MVPADGSFFGSPDYSFTLAKDDCIISQAEGKYGGGGIVCEDATISNDDVVATFPEDSSAGRGLSHIKLTISCCENICP